MNTKFFICFTLLISQAAIAADGHGKLSIRSSDHPLTVNIKKSEAYDMDNSLDLNLVELFQYDDSKIEKKIADSNGTYVLDAADRTDARDKAALDVRKVLYEIVNCYNQRTQSPDRLIECYGPSAQALMKLLQYMIASDDAQKDATKEKSQMYVWARALVGPGGNAIPVRYVDGTRELNKITFTQTVLKPLNVGSVTCSEVGSNESSKKYKLVKQFPYFCSIEALK